MTNSKLEVELKFHVDDLEKLAARLTEFGFQQSAMQCQEDIYWRHPCRNFADTDEAFRVRRIDQEACVTYKGPRQSGTAKIREEIELAIGWTELDQWHQLLLKLGFHPVHPVRKTRRVFKCHQMDRYSAIQIVLDQVEKLGNFAEIEILVDCQESVEEAQLLILELAKALELTRQQPRSYLSLLMQSLQA